LVATSKTNAILTHEVLELWQRSGQNKIVDSPYWTLYYDIGVRRVNGKGYVVGFKLFPPDGI
jgi:hypothetical protein